MAFGLALTGFILCAVAGFMLRLWWRARHPLEGPGTLEEALAEEETEEDPEEPWRRG
jgi:hypothetical protein